MLAEGSAGATLEAFCVRVDFLLSVAVLNKQTSDMRLSLREHRKHMGVCGNVVSSENELLVEMIHNFWIIRAFFFSPKKCIYNCIFASESL